jgi:hypothetical protein
MELRLGFEVEEFCSGALINWLCEVRLWQQNLLPEGKWENVPLLRSHFADFLNSRAGQIIHI